MKSSPRVVALGKTGKKLDDPKPQGLFQDVVQMFAYNHPKFTDPSPLFFPVSKILLPGFEKCRESWEVQPSQMMHGLGPHSKQACLFWCLVWDLANRTVQNKAVITYHEQYVYNTTQ